MTVGAVLLLVAIAAVCGFVGQIIAGYSAGGFLVSTGVGFLGALFGMWIASALDLPVMYEVSVGGVAFPLVWSPLGSAALVAVLGALSGGKRW
jgi:uncharacterized membrane protein YeaQ/YmgE (transglycosylase-associated protein family)